MNAGGAVDFSTANAESDAHELGQSTRSQPTWRVRADVQRSGAFDSLQVTAPDRR